MCPVVEKQIHQTFSAYIMVCYMKETTAEQTSLIVCPYTPEYVNDPYRGFVA